VSSLPRIGATIMRVLILAMILSGCGLTPLQQLKTASDSALQMDKVVTPKWDKKCAAAKDKCLTDGIKVSAKCKPLKDCQRYRTGFAVGIAGIHTLVARTAPLVAQGGSGGSLMGRLLMAVENVRLIAVKAGFLPGGSK